MNSGGGPKANNQSDARPAVRAAALLVAAVLAFFAIAIGWAGGQAIASRHYELPWREGGAAALGPVIVAGQARQGVEIYQGEDAVRFGAGLVFSGVMLGIWSATVFWCSVLRAKSKDGLRVIGQWATAASLLCLTLLSVCFFPVWELWTIWFWGEVSLWAAFFTALPWFPTIREWGRRLGIGVLAVAITGAILLIPGAFVGLALGLFISVVGMAHVSALWPEALASLDDLLQEPATGSS